jgi:hypothetical protein|tara:strand:- start:1722 stop:2966 length:1245 start_codon:yes stop_codon:yes gene_type:complete
MPINNVISVSRFSPECSFSKTITIADKGYESEPIYIANYSVVGINLSCTQNCTLSIIGLNHNKTVTSENFRLFYQKTLNADQLFQRRFNINYNYFIVQVFLDQSITPSSTAATIELNTTFLSRTQYNPAGFTNSIVDKDANANLMLHTNDFHIDLVRNMYTDFSKVNILGIHQNRLNSTTGNVLYPTSEYTLGIFSADFTTGNKFTPNASAEALNLSVVNSNDVNNGTVGANPPFSDATNTGAQVLTMIYIDTNGVKQSVDVVTGNGYIGVSAKSVLRISVKTAGSTNNNVGEIAVLNGTSSRIYAIIHPNRNVSQGAIYQVPSTKNLVLRNITINSFFQGGTLSIIENKNGLEYPLGVFKLNTNNNLINYDLDGLVEAGSYIYVNITPDGTTGGDNLINCNINAYEVPLLNSF